MTTPPWILTLHPAFGSLFKRFWLTDRDLRFGNEHTSAGCHRVISCHSCHGLSKHRSSYLIVMDYRSILHRHKYHQNSSNIHGQFLQGDHLRNFRQQFLGQKCEIWDLQHIMQHAEYANSWYAEYMPDMPTWSWDIMSNGIMSCHGILQGVLSQVQHLGLAAWIPIVSIWLGSDAQKEIERTQMNSAISCDMRKSA